MFCCHSVQCLKYLQDQGFFLKYATRNYLNLNGKIKHWKKQIHLQLQKTKGRFPDI